MKIEIVNSIDKLLSYKAEWELILLEINCDNAFLELDWIMLWWKYFGDRHDLFVLFVSNEQEVIGICPLMITRTRICKEIEFIGSSESGRMDFILRNEYRQEALEGVCNFLRDIKGKSIIRLNGIPEKSSNYTLIKKYLKVNKISYVTSCKSFYQLNIINNDFESCFNSRFGKKTKQTMNSKEKKFKSLGNLDYKRISPHEFDEVFGIHDKRWLRKIGDSSFSEGETKEFYKELALNKNMKFKTVIDAITLNNKIISFMYGFEYNKKYYFIRIAHDDDFYFLSPGELIFRKKIEECFLLQMRIVDFGPGYEPYKAKWTDDYDEVSTITLPSNNIQSIFIFFINYIASRKLKDILKKNKRIYNFRKHSLGKLKLSFSKENISHNIKKVIRNVDQNGLPLYLIKLFGDLASKVYSYKQYLIYEMNLKQMEVSQNKFQVIEATVDDLAALSEVMNESSNKIIRRFINKHRCYITLYKNKIIHYCWINCSSVEISNRKLDISFGNHDVHIYDSFIEKKFKNEYKYANILSNILCLLYKENYKRCYLTLKTCNKSFVNEILGELFQPKYKLYETKIFNSIKHSIVDIKLNGKSKNL